MRTATERDGLDNDMVERGERDRGVHRDHRHNHDSHRERSREPQRDRSRDSPPPRDRDSRDSRHSGRRSPSPGGLDGRSRRDGGDRDERRRGGRDDLLEHREYITIGHEFSSEVRESAVSFDNVQHNPSINHPPNNLT